MRLPIGNRRWSFKAFTFIILALGTIFILHQKNTNEYIRSDAGAYYIFLPAAFIYGDLTFSYINQLPENIRKKSWVSYETGRGYQISKMTAGVAVLQLPFFITAHILASVLGVPATGYSWPYELAIAAAALFYF